MAKAPHDGRIGIRELIDFMERCSTTLEKNGEEDASFYFSQIAEFIKRNPHKGINEDAGRILGV